MSIEKIGVGVDSPRKQTMNNAQKAQPRTYQGCARDSVSFGALSTKEIKTVLEDGLVQKGAIKFMKGFESLKGELGGILITAVGTGAVAPIFIGFNPFVRPPKNATKEEKEDLANTKLYTAMRQPISAGLAILFQASVQKYIDKILDSMFNVPERAKNMWFNLNRSLINTDTYLKGLVAKQLKEEGVEKPSALFSKSADRKAYKEKFDTRLEALQDEQLQKVADEFLDKNEIRIGEQKLDDKTVAELINKNIDNYISDSDKLQKTREAMAQYVEKADILHNNKEDIREMFKEIPIQDIEDANAVLRSPNATAAERKLAKEKLVKAYETAEAKITKDSLTKLYDNTKKPELKELINECLIRPKDLQASHAIRILERIDCIEKMCEGNYSAETYRKALLKKNSVLADRAIMLESAKIKNPAEASRTTIQETLKKVAEICRFEKDNGIVESVLRDTDVYSHNLEDLQKKLAKDIAKSYKKLINHQYKALNQVVKIAVGVFITLPITCTALNWVYPRFMEIFFPKLAGVKKNHQLQQQQQQNKVGGDK